MKKIIPFLGLLFTCPSLKAQESKWAVSFTPAVVQSPDIHFGFQPGVEYRFNDRVSLLTEITLTTKSKDPSFRNSKYLRIKPELRYALSASKHALKPYAGLQLSYSVRNWEDKTNGCFIDRDQFSDGVITYNSARVNSPVITGSLQFGIPFRLGHHFSIDAFMGFGMRIISTSYSEVESPAKEIIWRPNCMIVIPVPDPAWYANGTVKRFHANCGLRLSYRF